MQHPKQDYDDDREELLIPDDEYSLPQSHGNVVENDSSNHHDM